VLLTPLLVALSILHFAPTMAPVRDGSMEIFWDSSFHWEKTGGRVYGPWKDWFIYERQHMHGSDLYRVPEGEVNAHLAAALDRLEREVAEGTVPDFVALGFRRWQQSDAGRQRDLPALLAAIQDADLAELQKLDPQVAQYFLDSRQYVEERLRHSEGYWANQLFEWVFLSALALLVLWPVLRSCGRLARALHWGLAPPLFFLPLYLGYATFTFTSRGPSGGVLYPWLVLLFRNRDWPFFPWDRYLLAHLPPVLAPLSVPIGSPIVLSGGGMPGPTVVLALGILLASLVYVLPFLRSRMRLRWRFLREESVPGGQLGPERHPRR
jgi:hypothetical protein